MTDTKPRAVRRLGDIVFANLAFFAGVSILATLATVAAFLFAQSVPAFTGPPIDAASEGFFSYVLPFVFGTVYASVIGLAIATPLAIGIALYISHFANRRFAQVLGYAVDLLAAIPSVVYGLWGILVLAPFLSPTFNWLNENLGWIPIFAGQVSATGRTMLTVGIVLAIMVLPIMGGAYSRNLLTDPQASRGSCACTWSNQMGNDQDGSAAIWSTRNHLSRNARPRPGTW